MSKIDNLKTTLQRSVEYNKTHQISEYLDVDETPLPELKAELDNLPEEYNTVNVYCGDCECIVPGCLSFSGIRVKTLEERKQRASEILKAYTTDLEDKFKALLEHREVNEFIEKHGKKYVESLFAAEAQMT